MTLYAFPLLTKRIQPTKFNNKKNYRNVFLTKQSHEVLRSGRRMVFRSSSILFDIRVNNKYSYVFEKTMNRASVKLLRVHLIIISLFLVSNASEARNWNWLSQLMECECIAIMIDGRRLKCNAPSLNILMDAFN